jgi:hypothetical protein
MPVIVFMALMIVLLVFIILDRKQPAKALSRDQLSKGFVPGSSAKWPVLLCFALLGFFLALSEFLAPSVPPFTGRSSMLKALAYQVLGERGLAFVGGGLGAAFVVAAYVSYRSSPRR